jgi:hypothetical protein
LPPVAPLQPLASTGTLANLTRDPSPKYAPIPEAAVTEEVLPNGLRILVQNIAGLPVEAAVVQLRCGRLDVDSTFGALFPALTHGDNARFDALEQYSSLAYLGADLSSAVGPTHVALHVRALEPVFLEALDHAMAAAFHARPSDASLRSALRETGARWSAADARTDTSAERAWLTLLRGPDDPMVRVPNFSEDEDALPRWRALARSCATPSRASVIAAGPLPAKWVIQRVAKLEGDWKPEGTLPPAPQPVLQPVSGTSIGIVDVPRPSQVLVQVGALGPPPSHPDFAALGVASSALADHLDGLLQRELRHERGLTYGVNTGVTSLRADAYFSLQVAIDAQRFDEGLARLSARLTSLGTDLLKPESLRHAQDAARSSLCGWTTSRLSAAARLANLAALGLPANHCVNFDRALEGVTAEQVRDVAQRYLAKNRLRMVVVGDAAKLRAPLEGLQWGPVSLVR